MSKGIPGEHAACAPKEKDTANAMQSKAKLDLYTILFSTIEFSPLPNYHPLYTAFPLATTYIYHIRSHSYHH